MERWLLTTAILLKIIFFAPQAFFPTAAETIGSEKRSSSGLYRLGYRGTDAEMGAERFRQSEPSVDLAIPRIAMCVHPQEGLQPCRDLYKTQAIGPKSECWLVIWEVWIGAA